MPGLLGTAIVRVGGITAAMTGVGSASLRKAGRAFEVVRVHPLDHAGYFPGATPIHLVVLIDPGDGEILGAQAVGAKGVDKRIDVIATAMRGGLKAPDLIDLDLSYAPPYGSARDPVTMVGLVADNIITGQVAQWHPDQLDWALEEAYLLDVRTAGEFAAGHVRGAACVPHTELRARLEEVRAAAAGRPIAVMCQAGARSYVAHRVLAGAGIASWNLSGGMSTLRAWLGDEVGRVVEEGS